MLNGLSTQVPPVYLFSQQCGLEDLPGHCLCCPHAAVSSPSSEQPQPLAPRSGAQPAPDPPPWPRCPTALTGAVAGGEVRLPITSALPCPHRVKAAHVIIPVLIQTCILFKLPHLSSGSCKRPLILHKASFSITNTVIFL